MDFSGIEYIHNDVQSSPLSVSRTFYHSKETLPSTPFLLTTSILLSIPLHSFCLQEAAYSRYFV